MVHELENFGLKPIVHDPLADAEDAAMEGITLSAFSDLKNLDALILAVPHAVFREKRELIAAMVNNNGVFVDVRGAFYNERPHHCVYWSL